MFQYEAKVIRVIDGDTLEFMIDLGFNVHTLATVRLAHVNTPETVEYSLEGLKDPAKDFIMSKIPPGAVCVVNISRKEKYGRWLAEVYYLPGSIERSEIAMQGRQLNEELITAGLAVAYEGGRK
jgi:micrococcal nuclease